MPTIHQYCRKQYPRTLITMVGRLNSAANWITVVQGFGWKTYGTVPKCCKDSQQMSLRRLCETYEVSQLLGPGEFERYSIESVIHAQ